jgi:hypothetical protein
MTNDLNNLASSVWTKLPNPPRTEGHPASIVVLNDGKMVCTYSGRRNGAGTFTASSGVFLYDPVANTWADRSHTDMQYWTKDIVIDPFDPTQNTWYVCVFSGWGGAPNGKGGLFRSTDRGVTWTKLTGTQFDRVTSITFNPAVLSQAYLTTEVQGLWMSNNMIVPTPSWSLVNNYPFRQPERVFFNPFNANEIWVTSFGNGLKMGALSGPLPVKLVSFAGTRNNVTTQLQWKTANGSVGDRFEIERSTNALQYEKTGTVIANGNTNSQYYFTDQFPASPVYYRIRIIAASGAIAYSNTIAFSDAVVLQNDARLMKNPVSGNDIPLQVTTDGTCEIQVSVTTISGKIIMQQTVLISNGVNQLNIPLPDETAAGTYFIQLWGAHLKRSLQFVKIK